MPDNITLTDVKKQVNYAKEAFLSQYNIISLFGLGVFSALGGGIPALMIGLGAEMLYMAFIPEMKRFQRMVNSRKFEEERMAKRAKLFESIRMLNLQDRKKYTEIQQLVKTTEENYKNLGSMGQSILETSIDKINHLGETYLRLQILKDQHLNYLKNSDQDKIGEILKKLEQEIKDLPPRVKEIQQKRIEILRKRLEKFEKSKEHRQIINAQLLTIEDILKLLRDQSYTMKDPSQISDQLDSIMVDMESTEETVKEMEDLFALTEQYMPMNQNVQRQASRQNE